LFFHLQSVHAGTLTFHLSQPQDKVQTQSGSEAADPISPGVSLGPHFDLGSDWSFSPELGYIYNQVETKDRYGGKPKVETFYLLYDLSYSLGYSRNYSVRGGLGTFIKRIKGPGGTVTVPNGSGTSTAYRPGDTQTSYSGSINLGFEWYFSDGDVSSFFHRYRLFSEIFVIDPLFDRKRLFTYQIGIGANL
jgi:hypothetical protein